MNKRRRTALYSVLLLLVSYSVFSLSDEEIKHIELTTWSIEIETHISGIYPEAVQYAVFDSDPIALYKEALLRATCCQDSKVYC